MIEWKEKPIKALGRIITGKTPPKENVEYFEGGEELFVSPKDLGWNHFYVNKTQTVITDKALEKFKNQVLPKNAVMFTSLSFAFGKMGITSKNCLTNQQINSIIVNENHDYRFVYYLLKTYRPIIFSYNSGIDTPIVPKSVFESVLVRCPSLTYQKKIAAILSAYDDLIENNKRRIALLEKMAEEIYREWFVRFRFPDYQTAEFEKGIPKGWEAVELKDIAIENSKATKAGNHLENRFYLPLDIIGSKQFLPLNHYAFIEAKSSLVTFEKGEFIFGAMRPYQHKVVIAPFDGITRTTCFVLKPKEDYLYSYLYLTLFKKSTIDYAMLISNGTDRPYTVWNRGMERMGVLNPDQDTLKSFEGKVRPIIDLILEYYFIQKNLSKTRDTLLPRLISGKLSVEDLDIQFPPSMKEEVGEVVSG